MIFLFLTSIGALTVMKGRVQRDYETLAAPSLWTRERMLDAENERLDLELAALLLEHRRLAAGTKIDTSMLVDADLYERFAALEGDDDAEA